MAYEKQTWANGDVITAAKLNHMEDGIESAGGGGGTVILPYFIYVNFFEDEFMFVDTSGNYVSLNDVSQTPNGRYLCRIYVEGLYNSDSIEFDDIVSVDIDGDETSRVFVYSGGRLMGARYNDGSEPPVCSSIITKISLECNFIDGNGSGEFDVFSYDGTLLDSHVVNYSDPE